MRRVLFVAYYFPPMAGIGSIRAASFATHLPEFGWEALVLAPRETPHPSDPDLRFPEDRVVRSRSFELSKLAKAVEPQTGTGATTLARVRRSVRNAGLRVVFPDAQVGWYPGAVTAGLRALRRGRFDAVYSSSFPITAHLVGATLSRRGGVPWVAEFRDPWSDVLPPGPLRGAARRLESAIASRADRMVMPTPTWAKMFGGRWGVDVAVLPNGHEGPASPSPPPAAPTVTHVGSFYPHRQDLSALWEALRRIEARGSIEPPRVRFVGDLHPDVRAQAAHHGVDHLVEATGRVPHRDVAGLIQSSSALIAAGVARPDPIAHGWIPAKLFEYLPTGLPILYLGDPHGDAGQMLAEHRGCYVLEPGDADAVEAALQTALGDRDVYARDVDALSRRARAGALAEILDHVASA